MHGLTKETLKYSPLPWMKDWSNWYSSVRLTIQNISSNTTKQKNGGSEMNTMHVKGWCWKGCRKECAGDRPKNIRTKRGLKIRGHVTPC